MPFLRQEVDERRYDVWVNWEPAVGRLHIVPDTNPGNLSREKLLIPRVPDMFDDRVTEGDVERAVSKGESAAIADDESGLSSAHCPH